MIAFGDRKEEARETEAEMAKEMDVVARKEVEEDSFVEEITTGGSEEECARFKGNEDPETCKCDGTIPRMLKSGGYDIKAMIDGKKIDFNLEDSLGGDPPFRLVHYISSLDKMGKFLPILIEYGIVKEALEGAGIPLYRRGTHENGEQNDLGSWAF